MEAALRSTLEPAPTTRGSKASRPAGRRRYSSFQWVGGLVAALLAVAVVTGLVYVGHSRSNVPSPARGPQGSTTAIPAQKFQSSFPGTATSTWGWTSDGGRLLRTNDGGVHWTNVTPSGYRYENGDTGTPLNPYYMDATHAWIVASQSLVPSALGNNIPLSGPVQLLTLLTADGGLTWQKGTPVTGYAAGWTGYAGGWTVLLKYGPVADIDLDFIDYLHGWLLVPSEASRTLYSTSDGGLNWKVVARASVVDPTACRWSRLSFVSVSTGWMTNNCRDALATRDSTPLLVTHDGGVTWRPQSLPVATPNLCGEPQLGCFTHCPPVFGLRAAWFAESDWSGCSNPPLFVDALDGFLLVWSTSNVQKLLVTADGGTSWSVRSLPGEVQLQVEFIDADHGWAIAGSANQFKVATDSMGISSFVGSPLAVPLYRTDDGGRTWVQVHTNLLLQSRYGQFFWIHFVDLNTGFAVYLLGPPLRTTDGGRTWSVTTDGGRTWSVA
jgi:photosystem II stability/assembly factor-like uncharacterized protein